MHSMNSTSKGQTGFGYLLVIGGIILFSAASYFMIKGFNLYENEDITERPTILFSGPINMNGSGIYNVSEIIGNMVNITELIIHNTSSDKALYVRHDMTNAVIESTGSSPLMLISSLYMLLETASGNIVLKPAGSVGIGTESPSTKLDVNGTTTTVALDTGSVNDNVYYCSTLAEINDALSSIGTGGGTIIIESGTIPVTSTININGGGSYKIVGQGENTELDMANGNSVFSITSATSCLIENLKIDAQAEADITPAIHINETGNNKVLIRDVMIDGTGNGEDAYGIDIDSNNNVITNCMFKKIRRAANLDGQYNIFSENHIENLDAPDGTAGSSGIVMQAIRVDNSYNIIESNVIINISSGSGGAGSAGSGGTAGDLYAIIVTTLGSYTTIANNKIYDSIHGDGGNGDGGAGGGAGQFEVIQVSGSYCSITGNIIDGFSGGNGGNGDGDGNNGGAAVWGAGIRLVTGSYNSIANNVIRNIVNGNGGNAGGVNDNGGKGDSAMGIWVQGSYATVSGNVVEGVMGGNGGDGGTSSGVSGNGGRAAGIRIQAKAVSVTGNFVRNITGGSAGTVGGGGAGTDGNGAGIMIYGGDYGTVSGNVCTDNNADTNAIQAGILLKSTASNNAITGNACHRNTNSGTGTGYGIIISATDSDNLIYGNVCLNNDVNLQDDGTNTFGDATTNNVS